VLSLINADLSKHQQDLSLLRDEYQKMVTHRFGVPKPVTMQDYLEKKEYIKKIKKHGKWQSIGGAMSIGKVGLLPDSQDGQSPGEVHVQGLVHVKARTQREMQEEIIVHPLMSPSNLEIQREEKEQILK
jgi:hypothetical protein